MVPQSDPEFGPLVAKKKFPWDPISATAFFASIGTAFVVSQSPITIGPSGIRLTAPISLPDLLTLLLIPAAAMSLILFLLYRYFTAVRLYEFGAVRMSLGRPAARVAYADCVAHAFELDHLRSFNNYQGTLVDLYLETASKQSLRFRQVQWLEHVRIYGRFSPEFRVVSQSPLESLAWRIARDIASRWIARLRAGESIEWTKRATLNPHGIASRHGKSKGTMALYSELAPIEFEGNNAMIRWRDGTVFLTLVSRKINFYPGYYAMLDLIEEHAPRQRDSIRAREPHEHEFGQLLTRRRAWLLAKAITIPLVFVTVIFAVLTFAILLDALETKPGSGQLAAWSGFAGAVLITTAMGGITAFVYSLVSKTTEFFEHGVRVYRSEALIASIAYADLDQIRFTRTQVRHHGAYIGSHLLLVLRSRSGGRVRFRARHRERLVGSGVLGWKYEFVGDDPIDRVVDVAAAEIAQDWRTRILAGESIEWSPHATLTPDGVAFWSGPAKGTLALYSELSQATRNDKAITVFTRSGVALASVPTGDMNALPGFFVIDDLIRAEPRTASADL